MPSQKKIFIFNRNKELGKYMKYWLDQDIVCFICINEPKYMEEKQLAKYIILPKKFDRVKNQEKLSLWDMDIKFIGYLHLEEYWNKQYKIQCCKKNLNTLIYTFEEKTDIEPLKNEIENDRCDGCGKHDLSCRCGVGSPFY